LTLDEFKRQLQCCHSVHLSAGNGSTDESGIEQAIVQIAHNQLSGALFEVIAIERRRTRRKEDDFGAMHACGAVCVPPIQSHEFLSGRDNHASKFAGRW